MEHMVDPLAIGRVLYDDKKNGMAASLTEEAIWLFGEKAISEASPRSPHLMPRSRSFDAGGIYFMVDDEPCLQQMIIDGGPQGIGHSGHGHADALSLRFTIDRKRALIDPGTCTYISDTDERNLFRGTSAHNTLTVDGMDQAIPQGPFSWSSLPNVKTTWTTGKSFEFFVGQHNGYARLPDPVTHTRIVFHANGGFWLVRDIAHGNREHLLKVFWHFAPGLEVTAGERGFVAKMPESGRLSKSTGIALLTPQNSVWRTELLSGYDAPVYGLRKSAPTACLSARVNLPVDCAVLVLPLRDSYTLGAAFIELPESTPDVRAYRHESLGNARYVFICDKEGAWNCGPWSSDARLFYCAFEQGRLAHMVMVLGSFAKWHDKQLVVLQHRAERAEWFNGRTYCSDSSAIEYWTEANFELFHPVL